MSDDYLRIPIASGLEQGREVCLVVTVNHGCRVIGLVTTPNDDGSEVTDPSAITLLAPLEARELAAALLRAADRLEQE